MARIDFDSMHELYRTDYDESPVIASATENPAQAAGNADERSESDTALYRQAMVDGTQLAQASYCEVLRQTGNALVIALFNRAERTARRAGVVLDQKMYLEGVEAGFRSTTELMQLGNSQYESQSHSAQEDQERKARYDEDCREIQQDLDEVLTTDADAAASDW